MSLFSGMNLSSAPLDPRVPDGTYHARIFDVRFTSYLVNSDEHRGKRGRKFVIVYEILQGESEGLTVSESFFCNPWDSEQRKAYLNRRLLSLGLQPVEFDRVEAEDLYDREIEITVMAGRVRDVKAGRVG